MIWKITLTLSLLIGISHCERLNRYVRHYELLNYNTHELHSKHERTRRSIDASQELELEFEAHGRPFHLRLRPGAPYISHNLILETDDGAAPYRPDFLYIGNLKDKPKSKIHGGITNGMFQGIIYDEDDEYHIEQAKYHLDVSSIPDKGAHSVIYKSSDVTHPSNGGCGLNDRVSQWMNKIQNSRVDDSDREKRDANIEWQNIAHEASENKYIEPKRVRRAPYAFERTACSLYLQADHTYTAHYSNDVSEVILNLNNHVSAVNAIYMGTEFAQQNFQTIRDINFFIKRIRVNGTAQESDSSNPFRFSNLGVEKFLELNSLQNHNDYCLAYVFANRDFNDGVLGLAWVGSTGSTSGGICEKYARFQSVSQSLNTGVVTIQNYGSTVASKVSHITFAHELGHNFGSPHDYPDRCRPGDTPNTRGSGNYIMYASATSGDKPFNDEFSECSIGNMSVVIRANGGCFEESDQPICGNLVIDDGETCDCGYEDQCTDQCCNSQTCTLVNPNFMQCSPSQGPCCTSECQFTGPTPGQPCRRESECRNESYCTGYMAQCPFSVQKPDYTECNDHTQVCETGECAKSICTKFGLEECLCLDIVDTSLDEACHICCQARNASNTCMPFQSFGDNAMMDHVAMYGKDAVEGDQTVKVLYQMPGSPCNEYKGYCDIFSKCRNVDSNGPLSRLTNAILNPELYSNIAAWIQANWWAAVLIVLGVIIFMGLFIKCCSVHTPSSNPNLPKARKVSVPGTLRRRQHGTRGGQAMEMA